MVADRRLKTAGLAVLICLTITMSAAGQLATPGQNALDAASAGAVRSRSPGNMVSAGVAAALTAADIARAGVQIVETTRRPSQMIRILLDPAGDLLATISIQINRILGCLGSRLLARAGLISLDIDLCSAYDSGTGDSGGDPGAGRR